MFPVMILSTTEHGKNWKENTPRNVRQPTVGRCCRSSSTAARTGHHLRKTNTNSHLSRTAEPRFDFGPQSKFTQCQAYKKMQKIKSNRKERTYFTNIGKSLPQLDSSSLIILFPKYVSEAPSL